MKHQPGSSLLPPFVLFAALAACADGGPPDATAAPSEVASAFSLFGRSCHADGDCRRGYVCDPRSCEDDVGVCVPAPRACPDLWRPQCGCDGVTYASACERVRAGAAFRHRGQCTNVCGGIQGLGCDEGELCLYAIGVCGEGDQQGICVDRPTACPDLWSPVCGCDGETWANRCDALAAGVSIRHLGACATPCKDNTACGEDQLCVKDACWGEGTCRPRPSACTAEVDPVCGCDGQTYANGCIARQAGVNVAHHGPCPHDACGGTSGYFCEPGWFCDPLPGTCAMMAPLGGLIALPPPGICVEVTDACPKILAPVCGCDGVTYDNDCLRVLAKVGELHDGACEQSCGGFIGVPCDPGELCDLPAGLCHGADLTGVCVTQYDACDTVYAPVCGCDGKTYSNACFRILAGVQEDHAGACESATP